MNSKELSIQLTVAYLNGGGKIWPDMVFYFTKIAKELLGEEL